MVVCSAARVAGARVWHLHVSAFTAWRIVRAVFDSATRALALRLGLGDLVYPQPCHGYENGCVCDECVERSMGPPEEPATIPQPWDVAA